MTDTQLLNSASTLIVDACRHKDYDLAISTLGILVGVLLDAKNLVMTSEERDLLHIVLSKAEVLYNERYLD